MLTLLIVLVLLFGWGGGGGLGWAGYHGWRGSPSGAGYAGGGLIHLLLVGAVVIILLRVLGLGI